MSDLSNDLPFIFDREKQVLLFEGKQYSKTDVFAIAKASRSENKIDAKSKLFYFLSTWFDDNPCLEVRTSGSTSLPKYMQVEKERMIASACMSCAFFGLTPLQKTLLCMPLDFIGAKMLVVRALVAGLDLYVVKPSLHPFVEVLKHSSMPHVFDFVPMTPQQAWSTLTGQNQDGECVSHQSQKEQSQELAYFKETKHILLGGMAVGEELQEKIATFPNAIWSSYGMTETLSHIALRKLNGKDASLYFTPLQGVDVSLDTQSTLIIDAPRINKNTLYTKDLAEILPDGRFRIIGRADNCINSGGIKIQIEDVENALAQILKGSDISFQVTFIPDRELGEKLVLLLLQTCDGDFVLKKVEEKVKELPKYWKPKHIFMVKKLPQTDSGKPDRFHAKELAKACHENGVKQI